jgi:nitric oxide dioxygenase
MQSGRIALIQSSYRQLLPGNTQLAELFYARLFQQAPELHSLFKPDMEEQKVKLMGMLTFIVDNLLQLEALIPAIQALALRHREYGVRPEYYEPVGEALLWALEQSLGEKFTPEVRAAWQSVYTMLANTMIVAAES